MFEYTHTSISVNLSYIKIRIIQQAANQISTMSQVELKKTLLIKPGHFSKSFESTF